MGSRRRAAATVVVAAVFGIGAAAPAVAAGGPQVLDAPRAAAVQAVLDRVLGPGGAVVTVMDEVSSGPVVQSRVQYGQAQPVQVSASDQQALGVRSRSTVRLNAVDRTVTGTTTAGGTLLRESVAVTLDRSRLGTTSLKTVRTLVAAAAGLQGGRGDRLALVAVARFPSTRVAPTPPSLLDLARPYELPAAAALTGFGALLVLAGSIRRRRARSS